jgi:predicted DNA-binding protein (MmcQ/YjbR family)
MKDKPFIKLKSNSETFILLAITRFASEGWCPIIHYEKTHWFWRTKTYVLLMTKD